MATHKKYPALGRGLDALISTEEEVHTSGSSSINEVPVFKIKANPTSRAASSSLKHCKSWPRAYAK